MQVCMTLTDTVMIQHVGLYEANRQTLESAMTQDCMTPTDRKWRSQHSKPMVRLSPVW